MASISDDFLRLANSLKGKLDEAVFDFRARHRLFAPMQIITYRSYGTQQRIYIKGRVLANKKIGAAEDSATIFENLLNFYKRFETDEIPNAKLKIRFQEADHEVYTDSEGYFTLNLEPEHPLSQQSLYQAATISLLEARVPIPENSSVEAEIMVPPLDAEYGIISDIDDTILKSDATSLLRMSQAALFRNARTRLPFAGTTAFYKALLLGRNGKRNNPFFYVSSSPWNLYDMLIDFLDFQKLPHGPLLLRDIGLSSTSFTGPGHMEHKMKEIENILLTYPSLPFVLIGDSGQDDPRIYAEVIKKFPNRILAVYIREVEIPERSKIVVQISEELKKDSTVEMILSENSLKAAEHAAKIGLIEASRLPDIAADKKEDEKLPHDPVKAIEKQVENEIEIEPKKA